MKWCYIQLMLFTIIIFSACGGEDSAGTHEQRRELSQIEMSPNATCKDSCGGQSESGCWCDQLCNSYGDCCSDKESICNIKEKTCYDNFNCSDGEFCELRRGDCTLSQGHPIQGKCKSRPKYCPLGKLSLKTVCGCDGETYPNECVANKAGVSIASLGECPIAN